MTACHQVMSCTPSCGPGLNLRVFHGSEDHNVLAHIELIAFQFLCKLLCKLPTPLAAPGETRPTVSPSN